MPSYKEIKEDIKEINGDLKNLIKKWHKYRRKTFLREHDIIIEYIREVVHIIKHNANVLTECINIFKDLESALEKIYREIKLLKDKK